MAKSPDHRNYPLADIECSIVPAVLSGQFYVAELQSKTSGARAPIAAITWACVSAEVDRRLRETPQNRVRLASTEWKNGEHIWLVDMAGDPRALAGALRLLTDGTFKGKAVTVMVQDDSGAARAETLAYWVSRSLALPTGSS